MAESKSSGISACSGAPQQRGRAMFIKITVAHRDAFATPVARMARYAAITSGMSKGIAAAAAWHAKKQ